MITYITWKWRPQFGAYRSSFDGTAVNIWANMIERHAGEAHQLVCVTDDPSGIDKRVRIVPLWDRWATVPNPSNPKNPSCYRRLDLYRKDAAEIFGGEYLVSMDLDIVVTASLQPLFARREDFRIWGGQTVQPGRPGGFVYNWYNGSLMALRAGARAQVFDRFDPEKSPALAHQAGCRGSDQGWISYVLGKGQAIWGTKEGIFSYRNHVLPGGGRLPAGARFVAFHGAHDPWMPTVQARHDWVRKHYK